MIIHYCANSSQPNVEIFCTKDWHFVWRVIDDLPENCYTTGDGLIYTFEEDDVTCPECRKLIDQHTIKSTYNQWWPWIDINLPYLIRTDLPKPELTIDIDAIVLEKFGYTVKSLHDDYELKHEFECSSRRWELEQEFINNHPELSEEDAIDAAKDDNHPDLIEIKNLYKKAKEIHNFIKTIPEVIEFEKTYDEVTEQEKEADKNGCFHLSKYNRPGMLIEVKTYFGIKRFLIGDVDKYANRHGEDQEFDNNDIVLRACELISEDFLLKMKEL